MLRLQCIKNGHSPLSNRLCTHWKKPNIATYIFDDPPYVSKDYLLHGHGLGGYARHYKYLPNRRCATRFSGDLLQIKLFIVRN